MSGMSLKGVKITIKIWRETVNGVTEWIRTVPAVIQRNSFISLKVIFPFLFLCLLGSVIKNFPTRETAREAARPDLEYLHDGCFLLNSLQLKTLFSRWLIGNFRPQAEGSRPDEKRRGGAACHRLGPWRQRGEGREEGCCHGVQKCCCQGSRWGGLVVHTLKHHTNIEAR